jgi:hypothetical protein
MTCQALLDSCGILASIFATLRNSGGGAECTALWALTWIVDCGLSIAVHECNEGFKNRMIRLGQRIANRQMIALWGRYLIH